MYLSALCAGFEDNGAYWRSWYEMPDFEAEVSRLWDVVKPLYKHLHAYAYRKLAEHYGQDRMPDTGHIPAHLLGES